MQQSSFTMFLIYLLIGVVVISLVPVPARYYLMGIILLSGITYVISDVPQAGGLNDFWQVLTSQKSQGE